MLKRFIFLAFVAGIFFVFGLTVNNTDVGKSSQALLNTAKNSAFSMIGNVADLDTRTLVLAENPGIIGRIAEGGAFGGENSLAAAQNMFGRTQSAIDDVREKTHVIEVSPRSYLIRMPIVNAAFFVTDAGVVLIDTGMGPAGPAVLDAIRSVSDAPIHTIIYTHGHVDHAYGTWAIIEAGETPQIIAQDALEDRFNRYIRLRGSLAKYMSQPESQLPASASDLVWPTRYFSERLELDIGGEKFVLQHHKGETDDQLYVWVPGRKALVSADYYQGFLPNAGNGKRSQRYVEEWEIALREMAALRPEVLLPAHGAPIMNGDTIVESFTVLADALRHIVNHTIDGLNAGQRKDQIFGSVKLPEHLANHSTLNIQYVTPADISKMIIKKYTGWWDDIPSHWTPAPMADQGKMIIELAGGDIPAITEHARSLIAIDIRLASHLADWLFYARPENTLVQTLVFDVYKARIMDPDTNTMEMLTYLDQMTAAREQSRQQ